MTFWRVWNADISENNRNYRRVVILKELNTKFLYRIPIFFGICILPIILLIEYYNQNTNWITKIIGLIIILVTQITCYLMLSIFDKSNENLKEVDYNENK